MVGIFDSGIGGLSVLRNLQVALPKESFIYVGDIANMPYGNKADEKVAQRALSIAQTLIEMGCTCIIPACNTVMAVANKKLAQLMPIIPVYNIVETTREILYSLDKLGKVAVLATQQTVNSGKFRNAFACPNLAEAIEHGDTELVKKQVKEAEQRTEKFSYLALACTHYVLVEREFTKPTINPTLMFSGTIKSKIKQKGGERTVLYFTKITKQANQMIEKLRIRYERKETICV